jgi:Ser-tRNA(Ala) deacylase AlaX
MFDLNQLINDVITAVISVAGIVGLIRRGKLNVATVVEAAENVAHVVEDVAKTPVGKVIEAELKHKLNNAMEQLHATELERLAAISLNAFGATLESLSDVQKHAIVKFVRENLPGVEVSDDDIMKALEAAQEAAQKAAQSQLFRLANDFTQAIAQPQQQPAQEQQPVQANA